MAPVRKHVGRDKFSTMFGTLKAMQYVDPTPRAVSAIMYVFDTRDLEILSDQIATEQSLGMSPEV